MKMADRHFCPCSSISIRLAYVPFSSHPHLFSQSKRRHNVSIAWGMASVMHGQIAKHYLTVLINTMIGGFNLHRFETEILKFRDIKQRNYVYLQKLKDTINHVCAPARRKLGKKELTRIGLGLRSVHCYAWSRFTTRNWLRLGATGFDMVEKYPAFAA